MTKTRLAARIGAGPAALLADAFTRDAIAKAQALQLPLVIAASAPGELRASRYFQALARRCHGLLVAQGEGHLGLRMARALAPYQRRGALLIGTDIPSLPVPILQRAVNLLARHRVVLGPTLDGGYYLVGIRGTMPDMFSGIRWSTSGVLRQTVARLRQAGIRPALAPAWFDVDRWSDLMLLAEHLRLQPRGGELVCPHTARVLRRFGLLAGGG